MGRSSAFSYSASRYSYSYSKTPESIQIDHLFRESVTTVFGPLVNEVPILLFEYEYRFTEYEYEYEKNQWYESPATIMPDGPSPIGRWLSNPFWDDSSVDIGESKVATRIAVSQFGVVEAH